MHQRFFSIIVPCYNEERLIDTTLTCLTSIDYPKNRCEIIVVENGSTDRTFEIAKKYAFGNCRVYQSPKGVSRARNFGISMCAPNTECAIWLDADTFLKPDILNAINAYLHAHPDADFGTTDVYLDDETRAGRFWSWYINVTDRFLRIMHRIHIVRSYLLDKVEYDVDLVSGEDVKYSRDLARYGTYFFMPTDQVITSARRFKHKGYIKMFFINMTSGLPRWILKKNSWETIR